MIHFFHSLVCLVFRCQCSSAIVKDARWGNHTGQLNPRVRCQSKPKKGLLSTRMWKGPWGQGHSKAVCMQSYSLMMRLGGRICTSWRTREISSLLDLEVGVYTCINKKILHILLPYICLVWHCTRLYSNFFENDVFPDLWIVLMCFGSDMEWNLT